MSKKRKANALEVALARTWCYYCDREFNDIKVLLDHQKAKHFQCHVGNCHRRLNTVGGLKVHMSQVHKEDLHEVPNALDSRKGLDIEIFGMEGVPQHMIDQKHDAIKKDYYQAEAEHMRKTGNPLSGSAAAKDRNEAGANKKPKLETKEELKIRLAEHKAKKEASKQAKALGLPDPSLASSTPPAASTPQSAQDITMVNTPTPPAQMAYGAPPPQYSAAPQMPAYNSSSPIPFTGAPTASWPAPPLSNHTFAPTIPSFPGAPMLPNFPGAPALPQGFPGAFNGHLPAPPHGYPPSFPAMPMQPADNHYAAQMPLPARQGIIRDPASSFTRDAGATLSSQAQPTMTKEQVSAGIDGIWDTLTAQNAANPAGEELPSKSKPIDLPSKVQATANSDKENANQQEQAPKTPATEKGKSGKNQSSKLLMSDNLVSPEEKRARARRYQPKLKSSTMPTSIPTQGATGVVES